MRILVTGSTSKIGIKLINSLENRGNDVLAFEGKSSRIWKLGERIPQNLKADALIHLAHDRTFSIEENLVATQEICSSFQGLKIFLSSLSAHGQSRSKYGISKFESEKFFLNSNSVVLRAGIIYGKDVGGIFEKLSKLTKIFPIVPVPYRGNALLHTSHIDDLIDEITQQILFPQSKITLAANMYPISFYHLLQEILEFNNSSKFLFPLPRQPFDLLLRSIEKFFPKMTFVDSLLSLSKSVSNSELSSLNQPLASFRDFLLND